jgi:RuvB-like protein 2
LQGTEIIQEDIRRVYSVFYDEKRSAQYLEQHQDEFMFSTAFETKSDGVAADADAMETV